MTNGEKVDVDVYESAEQYTDHHLNNGDQFHCDMFAAPVFSELVDGCILATTS